MSTRRRGAAVEGFPNVPAGGNCAVWYQFCKADVSLMARAPIHDVRELTRPLKHEDDMAKKAKKAKKTAAATKKVVKKTTAKKKK
jgi:hypothetical protein